MRFRSLKLCVLAVSLTVAGVTFVINADDRAVPSPIGESFADVRVVTVTPDQVQVLAYPVAGLPVWMQGPNWNNQPKFASDVLTALIKTIDPESWQEGCGSIELDEMARMKIIDPTSLEDERGTIRIHAATATLVIRTTRANHDRIADLFEMLRGKNPDEEKETLSQSRNDDRIRSSVLKTIFRAERQRATDAAQAIDILNAEFNNIIDADLSPSLLRAFLDAIRHSRKSIIISNRVHWTPVLKKPRRPVESLVDGAMILPGQVTGFLSR